MIRLIILQLVSPVLFWFFSSLTNKIALRGKGGKMKKSLMLLTGLIMAVLAATLFTGCQSSLPTASSNDAGEGIINCKQFNRDVDSVMVNFMTIFTVNLPAGTGTPTAYSWNFGDGSPVVNSGVNQVQHVYTVTGVYSVVVTVTLSSGATYGPVTKSLTVYTGGTTTDEILTLISAAQGSNGKWTYRLGLAQSAYSTGSGSNPFITGTTGVVVTNPVNSTYNWVQLISQVQNGKLVVIIECYNQDDLFLNYGGNFAIGAPSSSWNWANIQGSTFFVSEEGGGNLRFSLRDGQLLSTGSSSNLPGLLGDDQSAAIFRMTAGADSLKLYFNIAALTNFNGGAFVEYRDALGGITQQPLPFSDFFTGWGEITLPLMVFQQNPFTIRYGHGSSHALADMTSSPFYSDGWLKFYIQPLSRTINQNNSFNRFTVVAVE